MQTGINAIMKNEVCVCIILGEQENSINSPIENYNIWKKKNSQVNVRRVFNANSREVGLI